MCIILLADLKSSCSLHSFSAIYIHLPSSWKALASRCMHCYSIQEKKTVNKSRSSGKGWKGSHLPSHPVESRCHVLSGGRLAKKAFHVSQIGGVGFFEYRSLVVSLQR